MSHVHYYALPRRSGAPLVPLAAAPQKMSGVGRRERVRRRAAQIDSTLDRLEAEAPLASYDLRLPDLSAEPSSSSSSSVDLAPADLFYASAASSSSSESSDSSDSEDERPTVHVGVATISVCQGKACKKRGADRVEAALHTSTAGLAGVEVHSCKCLGQCKRGPAVQVDMPDGQQIVYVGVAGAESAVQLAAVVLPSL